MIYSLLGCMFKGVCQGANTTWFDQETCTDLACQYNPVLKDLFIVEIEKGEESMYVLEPSYKLHTTCRSIFHKILRIFISYIQNLIHGFKI